MLEHVKRVLAQAASHVAANARTLITQQHAHHVAAPQNKQSALPRRACCAAAALCCMLRRGSPCCMHARQPTHLHHHLPYRPAEAAVCFCQRERRLKAARPQEPADAVRHVAVAADDDVLECQATGRRAGRRRPAEDGRRAGRQQVQHTHGGPCISGRCGRTRRRRNEPASTQKQECKPSTQRCGRMHHDAQCACHACHARAPVVTQ